MESGSEERTKDATDGSNGAATDFLEWLKRVAPEVPMPMPPFLDYIANAINTERPLMMIMHTPRSYPRRMYYEYVERFLRERVNVKRGPGQCEKCGGFIAWDEDIFSPDEPFCVNCGWRPTRLAPVEEPTISKRRLPDLSVFFYPIIPDGICFFYHMKHRCTGGSSYQVAIEVPTKDTITVDLCQIHLRYWERRARVTIIQEYDA